MLKNLRPKFTNLVLSSALITVSALTSAQHLWWKAPNPKAQYTCVYGQIKVLVTHPTIYYCGGNWWPGAPAGGYTGIQDKGDNLHNNIFSIWDTSPTLHPHTIAAFPGVNHERFGGEGTGAHTDFVYHWKVGETYQFYATKVQDKSAKNTLVTMYFYDSNAQKWIAEATIKCPNGTYKNVQTFGGSLAAFLENWSGQDKSAPKLALYRLWLGTSPRNLTPVVRAGGDGHWGVLNDWFFLAEGDKSRLQPDIERAHHLGQPYDEGGTAPLTITKPTISKKTLHQLMHLPKS